MAFFREANGFSERATVIIDEEGTVSRVKIYSVHSVPDIGEIIGWISEMDTNGPKA